ncbi:MAG: roadblock/LC7 domain-containing protein [Planctomycetes bacterium]|nr:roadblock/LC7 domain-containing protein [Planctomycetota bacterium]
MRAEDELKANRLVFYEKDIERVDRVLEEFLKLSGARLALLVDTEGHLVTRQGAPVEFDMDSVSALVAGSFAATKEMAHCLGEEEFSIMFHQGKKDSIQLTLVGDRALLGIVFDEETTIGMVRLYANETATKVAQLLAEAAKREPSEVIGAEFTEEAVERLTDVFGAEEETEEKDTGEQGDSTDSGSSQ